MTSDTLQEPEFFGAAAVIAGTLWAITTVLFSFITGGIVRSGLLSRVGIDLVLLVSSALIITISNLFLVGMVVALSMLMPPGPRAQHMQDIPEALAMLSVCGAFLFIWFRHRKKARERLGKDQMWLLALYVVCLFFILAFGLGSSCIAHGQDPDFNERFCRAVGFNAPRADSVVIAAVTWGCLLSLFLGVASMQTELIASISEAPKPPDGHRDAQHLADTQGNDRGDAEGTSMWRKLIAQLTFGPTEKERFLSRWNLVDRIFKLVQWLVTIGVIAALAQKMRGTFYSGVLIVIAVVLFLAIISSLVALGDALEPRLSEVDHKVYRVLARVGAIAFVGVCLLAFSQALVAILTAETH
jgi:hypothetical protein